jgi:hypothetical protein
MPCIIFSFLLLLLLWNIGLISQFHDYFTGGRTPWTGDQLVAILYLNTGQHKHRINAYTHQTSIEPTISAPERANTVHALDRSATVTRKYNISVLN